MGSVATAAASNLYTNSSNANTNVNVQQPQQTSTQGEEHQWFDYQCYNCGRTVRIYQGMPQCPNCGAEFQW